MFTLDALIVMLRLDAFQMLSLKHVIHKLTQNVTTLLVRLCELMNKMLQTEHLKRIKSEHDYQGIKSELLSGYCDTDTAGSSCKVHWEVQLS